MVRTPLKATFDSPVSFHHVKPGRVRFIGWCFHPEGDVQELLLTIDDARYRTRFRSPRPDVAAAFPDCPRALRSGFDVTIPLETGVYRVGLKARVQGMEPQEFDAVSLLVVGDAVPGFVRSVSYRVARRLSSGERLPSIREIPQLVRGLMNERLRAGRLGPVHGRSRSHVDVPAPVDAYSAWLAVNRWGPTQAARLRQRLDAGEHLPTISVITPVFRPDLRRFLETAASVRQQIYSDWEWCLADDASGDSSLTASLSTLAAEDSRIRVMTRDANGHISRASNSAAGLASGDFMALLDHDDLLSPDALGEVALHLAAHPEVDVLYSDEDKIDDDGARFDPHFKPGWSPEALLGQMYMGHLFVVRRSLFERVGGFRAGFEGSQDHDLALRVTELAREIGHIPKVLYHWRATEGSTAVSGESKPYSFDAGVRAVEEALTRRGAPAKTERSEWAAALGASLFRHRFPDEGPSVTVIIPTRNQPRLLARCLASLKCTTYRNFEVVIVDDQSDDPAFVSFLDGCGVPVLRAKGTRDRFNFSRLCNETARTVVADYLVFLNDDTEIRNPSWLSQMTGFARLDGVGCVGARLLFPDETVQHAGVMIDKGSVALAFRRQPAYDGGYLAGARVCRNCVAVTAACMLTPRKLFLEVGGFDEEAFPISFNDVDYCLRIADKGYRSVYAAEAELLHDEGASREPDSTPAELAAFRQRYRTRVDPYVNPNLSAASEILAIQPRRLVHGTAGPINVTMFGHALDLTGAPLCQFELTIALMDRGVITPRVVSGQDGPLRARYERRGIPVAVAPELDALVSETAYDTALTTLTNRLRETRTEVVYANTLKTFYGIAAAQRLNLPSLWNIRESEPWREFYADLPDGLLKAAVDCFAHPYRVVFVSRASRAVFEELNARHNFAVVPDGFAADEWNERTRPWTKDAARRALGIERDDVAILSVGTVCERKGQHDLVRALGRMRPELARRIRCFIVGDRPDPYSDALAELVSDLEPFVAQRISVIPETVAVEQYYQAADVFVCTSRVESYPRVTLEAMASELPIISTPVFGLSEQLVGGANATFYAPGAIASLASAIEDMVLHPDRRSAMARQSSAVLASLKSFDEMLDDYQTFFQEAAQA